MYNRDLNTRIRYGVINANEVPSLLERIYYEGDIEFFPDGEAEALLKCEDGVYQLTYLGGAPLIFVVQSAFLTKVKECSPCAPGAGDLDSPAEEDEDGVYAYAPPPYYFEGKPPFRYLPD